ncbi:hypothetical protein Acr_05g0001740 [Actinidia rufa]|uniref:Uncharacterized protein n=1 Tax=Actinidia rufa TaxID=165716 RepID=A0A7J0EJ93_9ERIC|nr:hypothetical protein Acr_05g0001740 [Actinidia rufa]
MAEREEDNDSDAPEEFTSVQGLQQDVELRKVQRENKASIAKLLSIQDAFPYHTEEANLDHGLRGVNLALFPVVELLSEDDPSSHWQGVVREGKERRRGWAQKKTPKKPRSHESIQDEVETEGNQGSLENEGLLPNDIVKLLAAREKQVFVSDSEEEKEEKTVKKTTSKKKKPKSFGIEPIILKDMPPPQCLQNSLEFLKKRKMLVSRSSSVLNNSNQALRLLSSSGVSSKK